MKYQFHLTCRACPEQYDVMDGHHIVAYVRYRHGYLTVNPVLPKWETRRFTPDDRERTEQVYDFGTDIISETLGDMWDGRKPSATARTSSPSSRRSTHRSRTTPTPRPASS